MARVKRERTDLAVLAHDIRGPLTAMLGYTRLLADEPLTDTGQRRLRIIEAQIDRVVAMLQTCEAASEGSQRDREDGAKPVAAERRACVD
jgi:signal transduction histidine kinase